MTDTKNTVSDEQKAPTNEIAFKEAGLPFEHPDCRFYRLRDGKPARYPNGMTAEQWANGPAKSSALRAAELPED